MRRGMQGGEQNGADTADDRIARRRARRWSRRAKIVAPFLAIPVILALLILSVDLIEYRPQDVSRRANEPTAPDAPRHSAARVGAIVVDPQSVSALSVVELPFESALPRRSDPATESGDPGSGAGR